jgi:starch synthase (maltosyl-transferring)
MTQTAAPIIYNLFPPLVGSVARWSDHLDRIKLMNFNWIFVNSFHYPGFSGSLYAVSDYYRLNPALDDGSGRSAILQLTDFVTAAERQGLAVMMDLIVNHTARDSPLVAAHPDWYRRNGGGALLSPGAIDPADSRQVTTWGDLAELDFSRRRTAAEIIEYFEAVAAYYVRLGVRGFRCDAAYKIPGDIWADLITAVRKVRPDVLFVAETLGCRPDEVEALRSAGFDFLFNSSKWSNFREPWLFEQYQTYGSVAPSISFPESHDTPRLAAEAPAGSDPVVLCRQRYAFAAVFASGLLMPIGFEYGFQRPLHVVTTTPADWEQPQFDLTEAIAAWNRLHLSWPGFAVDGPQRLIGLGDSDVAVLLRCRPDSAPDQPEWSLTLINPDLERPREVTLAGIPELDAATEAIEVTPQRARTPVPAGATVPLAPGEVRVLLSPAAARSA